MRVLIADDSVLLREGLALILADGGHEVVGGVGDGEALVSEALRLRPDVVVADIRMPPSHTDEGLRETTVETLSGLKPAFQEGGTVTAGNGAGINDAAALLVLASEAAAREAGATPLARIVSWGIGGVDPAYMGLGPVAAVPKALEKAGLKLSDIDLIESNEAFSAQALAVQDQLGFDPEKTNIDGGAVALGHPIGATGAILTVKLLSQLRRTGKSLGLVTLCIGGGQGIAAVVEAL